MADSLFSTYSGTTGADSVAYALGTKFTTDVDGTITHARWYAVASETGIHVVRLWQGTTLLADYTHTASGAGWIEYQLPDPVSVTAGVEYTIHVSTGTDSTRRYANQSALHGSIIQSGNLNAPVGAGVFSDASTITRPTSSFNNSGYYRDVIFVPAGVTVTTKTAATNEAAVVGTAIRGAQTIADKVAATSEAAVVGTTVKGAMTVPAVTVATSEAAVVGSVVQGGIVVSNAVAATSEAAVSGSVTLGGVTVSGIISATSEAAVSGSALKGALTIPAVVAATSEAAVVGTAVRGAQTISNAIAATSEAAVAGTVPPPYGVFVTDVAAAAAVASISGTAAKGALAIPSQTAAIAIAPTRGADDSSPWFRQLYPLPEVYQDRDVVIPLTHILS